ARALTKLHWAAHVSCTFLAFNNTSHLHVHMDDHRPPPAVLRRCPGRHAAPGRTARGRPGPRPGERCARLGHRVHGRAPPLRGCRRIDLTGSSTARLPLDPLHPDHEMYQRLLAGVTALDRWGPAQASNLAAALYADLRTKQPHMLASDLGRVLAGDPIAQRPSLFAAPRSGYHSHTS